MEKGNKTIVLLPFIFYKKAGARRGIRFIRDKNTGDSDQS